MTSRILSIFFLFFIFKAQHLLNSTIISYCLSVISQWLLGTASVYMRTCKTSAAVRLLEFIFLSMYTP